MKRVSAALCCALLSLTFGAASSARSAATVAVTITLVTVRSNHVIEIPECKTGQASTPAAPCTRLPVSTKRTRTTQRFSFTCNPTKGNLRLVARLCEDIRLYPGPMLHPPTPTTYPHMRMCLSPMQGASSTTMTVQTKVNGVVFTFDDELGGCYRSHPEYDAIRIYNAAISEDARTLAAIEPGLRCAADASFLCAADINYLLGDLIQNAERARPIARLDPGFLFHNRSGTDTCSIAVRGRNAGTIESFLPGRCSVSLKGLAKRTSKPTVIFTEEWPVADGKTANHVWNVQLASIEHLAPVLSVTESGAKPPQLSPGPLRASLP